MYIACKGPSLIEQVKHVTISRTVELSSRVLFFLYLFFIIINILSKAVAYDFNIVTLILLWVNQVIHLFIPELLPLMPWEGCMVYREYQTINNNYFVGESSDFL